MREVGRIRYPSLIEVLDCEPSRCKRSAHLRRETNSLCSVQNESANLARRRRLSRRGLRGGGTATQASRPAAI